MDGHSKKVENENMIISFVKHLRFIVIFLAFSSTLHAVAESAKNKSPFPVKYRSETDEKIILKTLTLAPVYDNVNGVYAEPVQKLLIDLLQSDKVWGYAEFPVSARKVFIEQYDSQPAEVLDVLSKSSSQGLLTAFITKGPKGLNAKMKLFTQDQGLVLLEEEFSNIDTFEVSKLRESFVTMYHNLKNRLPYYGYILSRRGLEVTLNLGTMNGVNIGQELALAQILKINRHPKLKNMIGVEKEIIGKVKVTQVEPYLSFAQITFEKEVGVLDVGAKILPSDYIAYPMPKLGKNGEVIGDNISAQQAPKSEEEKAAEAQNFKSPVFLTIQGIISQYSESSSLVNTTTPSSSQSFAPGIFMGAKYYLQKDIYIDFGTQQSIFNGGNSLSGSSPSILSYTSSTYAASVAYDYFPEESDDTFKLTGGLGYISYKTQVSNSAPTALTSTQTDSLALQINGSMALPEYPVTIGARLDLFLTPKFSESPVDSGKATVSITSIGAYGFYQLTPKMKLRADLGLTKISSSFGGAASRSNPARSTDIQMIDERVGIEYSY